MDVAAAVRVRILQIGAVTALVNARVWTGPTFPQSPTLPGVKVMRVGGFETMHLKGASGLRWARAQVDIIAATRAAAVTVEEAIDGDGGGSGLTGWSGEIGSPPFVVLAIEPLEDPRELFDPDERNEFRLMREYRVSFAR